MAHKQTAAREFPPHTREIIISRDRGNCIFCQMGYCNGGTWMAREIKSIMHYIPRSKGGLGIEQNGAVGCQRHHDMMDNGNSGRREEMLQLFRDYLQQIYPDWSEQELVYNKWRFLG